MTCTKAERLHTQIKALSDDDVVQESLNERAHLVDLKEMNDSGLGVRNF